VSSNVIDHIIEGMDPLTMGYFDNHDNGLLNKYKKKFKNRKIFIDMLLYLMIDSVLNFMQFHYRLIVHPIKLEPLQIV
jgi:hypothetical protein